MAEFLIDEQQFAQLKQSVADLSNNIGKWQAKQTEVIQTGLTGLIAAVTGADIDEIQAKINALSTTLEPEADALESKAAQANEQSNEGA